MRQRSTGGGWIESNFFVSVQPRSTREEESNVSPDIIICCYIYRVAIIEREEEEEQAHLEPKKTRYVEEAV